MYKLQYYHPPNIVKQRSIFSDPAFARTGAHRKSENINRGAKMADFDVPGVGQEEDITLPRGK